MVETESAPRNAGRVLIVDDDVSLASVLELELERLGFTVETATSGRGALALSAENEFDVVLLDLRLGKEDGFEVLAEFRRRNLSSEIIVLTGHGTIESAVEAMRLGAREYLTKPCKLDELEVHLAKAVAARRVLDENLKLKEYLAGSEAAKPFITGNPRMQTLLDSLDRVAQSDVPVLIQGESGTGKELIARRIHQRSPWRDRPFLAVNCAVLRAELLESELFGHEKGAFTGATRRKLGLFEIASGGTLFLDEIGEIDESIQAKLLRVLQSGELRRLGSTDNIFVRTRVVAATNKELEREVEEGHFRQDLFFRLNVVMLASIPLRERKEDIRLLFEHYLGVYGGSRPRHLADDAAALLERYSWPGNVRELENVVRRALIFYDQETIDVGVVRAVLPNLDESANENALSLAEVEKRHVLRILLAEGNDKRKAAEILGISLKTLYNRLHAWGAMGVERSS